MLYTINCLLKPIEPVEQPKDKPVLRITVNLELICKKILQDYEQLQNLDVCT